MKLCNEFIIKDLFDYMILNETDILEEIGYCNLSIMTDVVKIGTIVQMKKLKIFYIMQLKNMI